MVLRRRITRKLILLGYAHTHAKPCTGIAPAGRQEPGSPGAIRLRGLKPPGLDVEVDRAVLDLDGV